MLDDVDRLAFPRINRAYNTVFQPDGLSLGLVLPIEAYEVGTEPGMARHLERAKLAEALGFSAIWLRDVPFNVPSFGDVGQMFDPFVYLGALAMATDEIALGVASIILPLRHPAHVAKAAASADGLSGGRMLLGVASGDRPEEYPALNMTFPDRGERFRESLAYIRAMAEDYPHVETTYGRLSGDMDMLPKPVAGTHSSPDHRWKPAIAGLDCSAWRRVDDLSAGCYLARARHCRLSPSHQRAGRLQQTGDAVPLYRPFG